MFDYFSQKNSFVHDKWIETLAMLFLEVGLPTLAAQCYEQSVTVSGDNSINKSINRIKSLLYSGCVEQGLELINSMERIELPIELLIEEISAYLLSGDYLKAKQRALELWENSPQQRSRAWALLTIIARMSSSAGYTGLEKSREPEVIQTYLLVLENCLRFTPKYSGAIREEAASKNLAKQTIDILIELSVESNMCLIDYMQRKAEATRYMLDYKYRAARGLCL